MNQDQIKKALTELRANSKKRNFDQSIDFIVNLKDINIKKTEENVDSFVTLPHFPGRKSSICAIVGDELKEKAKIFDKVISNDNFDEYTDKNQIKKLSKSYDIFLSQASMMGKVATTFGKVLGPKGKMPNPKAGHVLTPDMDLEKIKDKLNSTVRLKTKNEPIVKASIGKESMTDDQLIDNFTAAYNALAHALPKEENNINIIYLKTTMGKPVKVIK
jgi:large subunit ribosomal protein L1